MQKNFDKTPKIQSLFTTGKTIMRVKRLNGITMFTIIFALFILMIGITAGLTYSGFQSTSQSNGTLTFAVNGHHGTLNLTNTKVVEYDSTDLLLTFTLASDTNYTTPTISGITMGGVALTKDGNNFKSSSIIVATYSTPTLTINRANVSGDLLITGSSTASTYTITYNSNGGTGSMSSSVVNYGTTTTLTPNAFTRDEYIFLGWATSTNGSVEFGDGARIKDLGSTTLYAKWTENAIVFDDQNKAFTFTTTSQTTTITGARNGSGNYTYSITAGNSGGYFSMSGTSITASASTPANTYNLTVTLTDNGYNVSKTATITIVVNKASGSITAPTAKSLTYNGSAQELVNAGSSTTGTVQYKLSGGSYSANIPTGTNATTYTVYYKCVGDTNHEDVAEASFNVTINQKALSITADNKSMTYGNDAPTYSYTQSGLVSGDSLSGTADYVVKSGNTIVNVNSSLNAGTYTIYVSGLSNANYDITFNTGSLTVSRANLTSATLNMAGYTYGTTPSTPSVSNNSGNGVVTYTYSDSENGTYTAWSGITSTTLNAGTYYMKASIAQSTNYNAKNLGPISFVVSPSPLGTPTNLSWSGGTASWGEVSNATSYTVTLYKNGTLNATQTGVASTSYNFASAIATDATTWTFKVQAIGSGNYSNSALSSVSSTQTTYSVVYNLNGASGTAPSTQYKIQGVAITLTSTTPTRSPYTFKGWGTDGATTTVNYASGASYTANSSITLYAIWDDITLTVTNTTGYYYISGSLYTRSSAYYKCLTCNNYSTSSSNTSGCTHNYSGIGYKCANCNYYGTDAGGNSSNYCSSTYHPAQASYYDNCTTCNGSGYNYNHTHNWYLLDDSGGVFTWHCYLCGLTEYGIDEEPDAHMCSSCGGSGLGTYHPAVAAYYTYTAHSLGSTYYYNCSYCSNKSTSSANTTGCTGHNHNYNTGTLYYDYTRQYGSGSATVSKSSASYSTGYYWHATYGALKMDSTLSYTDGYTYRIIQIISSTSLKARRET